jgi:predicted  nucleic acid-binding Zn-ribbon protein
LVNQLVEQSLAQQEHWNAEKSQFSHDWSDNDKLGSMEFKRIPDTPVVPGTAPRMSASAASEYLMRTPLPPSSAQRPTSLFTRDDAERESDRDKIKFLLSQVSFLESSLSGSNKQCSTLLLELETAKAELATAQLKIDELVHLHDSISTISSKASDLQDHAEQAVKELNTMRSECDKLNSEILKRNIEIEDLSHELKASFEVNESMRDRIAQLEAKMIQADEEMNSERRSLNRALSVANEEVDVLKIELNEKVRLLESLQASLKESLGESKRLRGTVDELTSKHGAEISQLRAEIIYARSDSKKQGDDLTDKMSSLLSDLAESEATNMKLKSEVRLDTFVHICFRLAFQKLPCLYSLMKRRSRFNRCR